MEQKKLRTALVVCLALFVLGCVFSIWFSGDDTVEWNHSDVSTVVISEIMSANRTYPAPNGEYLDFVEVHNLSDSPVDISGYMLADDLISVGYTFPEGTVLPGHGYAVCWCSKDAQSEEYASFGISREGGETIYLYNRSNVQVDAKAVPYLAENTSLIREDEDSWTQAEYATPGFANTQAGYEEWLAAQGGNMENIVISEILTDNSCIAAGGQICDWVELANLGGEAVVLDGAYLSDDPADPLKWQITSLTLGPGEYAVIPCGAAGSEGPGFALSKSGCTVILTGRLGNILSQVDCPALETDHAWALGADGTWSATDLATPGFENTQAGYGAWMAAVGAEDINVAISEIQTSNYSTVTNQAGALCDWVELVNLGDKTVDLSGAYLSDDPAQRGKWQIPSLILEPGQRAVICCSGPEAGAGEADFALSKSGCTLILTGSMGNIIDKVACPRLEDDRVWALQADGSYEMSDQPSPGYGNTTQGWLEYRGSRSFGGGLEISEVMAANNKYLIQSDGEYYDWVELVNTSSSSIELSDYCLSNDPKDLAMFRLPKKTLAPGERVVVICSGGAALAGNSIQAPFSLDAQECWVYISKVSGGLSDCLRVFDVPYQGSMGRSGGSVCYFTTPTPGRENGPGVAQVSDVPEVATPAGVYDGLETLAVEITGSGTLHYTLDGSVPTESAPVYDGPLILTETATVRVVNLEPGKAASNVVTASYILNEGHTLPVAALTVDPDAMFGAGGLYSSNAEQEAACNLTFFDGENGFSMDCGLEIQGNAVTSGEKKSFKLNFRGLYGASVLGTDVFGQEGSQVFDELYLQAGQDYTQTIFRDELFSQLASQMSENVLTQRYRFCVLYINGEYWGIYVLKEAFSELSYAAAYGVAEDSVTVVESPAAFATDIQRLAAYCAENDMSQQANYDYAASQLDLDSLIDWMILQGYSGNPNIDENLRYFRSTENGNCWQLAFYDQEGAFYYHNGFENLFGISQPYQYLQLTKGLIQNEEFRARFLERLSGAMTGALSDENVLAAIDGFQTLLEPEISRERQRWGGSTEEWTADVDRLRTFLTRYDHWGLLVEDLKTYIGLTDAEAASWFGR